MALNTNLQAAYNLSNTTDDSGNGNTLTNTGTVTFGAGLIGNCAQMGTPNSTKYLSINSNLGLALSGDWTVSYWVRNTSAATIFGVMEIVWGGGTKYLTAMYDGANTRIFALAQGTSLASAQAASANTWYNIMIVNSGTTATFYWNNTSKGTISTASTTTALTQRFEVGHCTVGLGPFFSPGDIDIAQVWTQALDATDRAAIYNAGAGQEYPFPSATVPSRLALLGVG